MLAGVLCAVMAVLESLVFKTTVEHETLATEFGYPVDIVEDCHNYPDHVFRFIEEPPHLRGRPYIGDPTEKPLGIDNGDDEDEDEIPLGGGSGNSTGQTLIL